MEKLAMSRDAPVDPRNPQSPEVFIAMGSPEAELARCQPTEQDFNHTLRMIESCSQAIEENPLDPIAYSDRALALAFLGRDLESRQDQAQATRLGLDASIVEEEISLIRGVAIGFTYLPADHSHQPLLIRRVRWPSFVSSLFGW